MKIAAIVSKQTANHMAGDVDYAAENTNVHLIFSLLLALISACYPSAVIFAIQAFSCPQFTNRSLRKRQRHFALTHPNYSPHHIEGQGDSPSGERLNAFSGSVSLSAPLLPHESGSIKQA
ncbi:MAG: hypothetical protein AB7U82_12720 [Blastocatellales bacterium]